MIALFGCSFTSQNSVPTALRQPLIHLGGDFYNTLVLQAVTFDWERLLGWAFASTIVSIMRDGHLIVYQSNITMPPAFQFIPFVSWIRVLTLQESTFVGAKFMDSKPAGDFIFFPQYLQYFNITHSRFGSESSTYRSSLVVGVGAAIVLEKSFVYKADIFAIGANVVTYDAVFDKSSMLQAELQMNISSVPVQPPTLPEYQGLPLEGYVQGAMIVYGTLEFKGGSKLLLSSGLSASDPGSASTIGPAAIWPYEDYPANASLIMSPNSELFLAGVFSRFTLPTSLWLLALTLISLHCISKKLDKTVSNRSSLHGRRQMSFFIFLILLPLNTDS